MKKFSSSLSTLALVLLLFSALLLFASCFGESKVFENKTEESSDPSLHVHTWSNWIVLSEPSKTEDGERQRACFCGESESERIPAIGSLGLEYTVNADGATCTVTGPGICRDEQLYIPEVIDGYTVTAIGEEAFAYGSLDLISVTVPGTVKTVGTGAFREQQMLTSLTVSEGVTYIGRAAFYSCSALNELILPDSVEIIGKSAFFECKSLGHLKLSQGLIAIENSAFAECENLPSVELPDRVRYVQADAFRACKNLEYVSLSNSMTEISDYLFSECVRLKNITVPESVTRIGSNAFAFCGSLTDIVIPKNVKEIGKGSFRCCDALTDVFIGASVYEIGNEAFFDCSEIENILVDPDNLYYQSIEGSLYSKNGFVLINYAVNKPDEEYIIPDGVIGISSSAFRRARFLKQISIPDSVCTIGYSAFAYCSELKEITLPENVVTVGGSLFYHCSKLERVTLDCNRLSNIQPQMFFGCGNLREITIPESVVRIGNYAFSACSNLETIRIPANVKIIEDYAFEGCFDLVSITGMDGVMNIDSTCFSRCRNLEYAFYENAYYLGNSENPYLILIETMDHATSCSVYEGTRVIAGGAFKENVVSVSIPNSVKSIGDIEFPSSVTNVSYAGTVEEWRSIQKAFVCFTPLQIVCSDGIVEEYPYGK